MDENIFLSYRALERPRWKEKERDRERERKRKRGTKEEEREKECRKCELKKDKP